jgi:hypothetical protein
MHLLFIALLSILAGVLLLAKTRKEQLGKFFTYISWFFVVVGFILFVGFICGAAFRLSHGIPPGRPGPHHMMMMKGHPMGMEKGKCCAVEMKEGKCCPGGMTEGKACPAGMMGGKDCKAMMENGKCCGKMGAMAGDSVMKCCPAHAKADSVKLP